MSLDLRSRIHADADDNQQGSTSEEEGNIQLADQNCRQDTDNRHINCAGERQPPQHGVKISRCFLARLIPGTKPPWVLILSATLIGLKVIAV